MNRKEYSLLVENWFRFLNESTIDRIFKSIQTLYFYNESKVNKGKIQLVDEEDFVGISYLGFDGIRGSIECENISESAGYGEIVLADNRQIWQISYSSTSSTWGPLLYDVCLEYISVVKGGALMSDRNQVSDEAYKVWEKYLNRSDVEKVQMDFGELDLFKRRYTDVFGLNRNRLPGHLGIEHDEDLKTYSIYYNTNEEEEDYPIEQYTPSKSNDDINQHSTFASLIKKGKSVEEASYEWLDSPLSKAYYKNNLDVINKLKNLSLYSAK